MSKDKKVQDELQSLDQQIGQRLRYFRQLSGISQRDLGTRIGCSFQQVQKYESGKNRISAPRLVMVSRALGVSSEALVASEDKVRIKTSKGIEILELNPHRGVKKL